MRIIDQQKESNNKCSLSDVPPPSTTTATAAAAAEDGDVGDLPTMTLSRRGRSTTSAVPHPPGKGGAVAMEEAAMTAAEYDRP